MLGQILVEPDAELELEPDDEPEEPVPVLPDPELPEFVLTDGVVVEEFELLPEFPVVVDVRRRIFMGWVPFRVMCHAEPVRFGADTMRPGCWGDRRRA